MRIALVTDWFLPRAGGIETQVGDLARALKAAGHAPRVITTTPGGDIDGVDVTRVPGFRWPWLDICASPSLWPRLRAELVAGQFDVVHAHVSGLVAPTGFTAAGVAQSLGLPTVITYHSTLDEYLGFLRLSDRVLRWSRDPILFTAVSSLVARQLSQSGGGVEVLVLPNGVDISRWNLSPQRPPAETRPIVAFATLRLNARKRPLQLIESFARAKKIVRGNGRRILLRIAGDGPKRRRVDAAISRLGLSDDVAILGGLKRDDLLAHYAQADFFVLPSIRESFGIAALEARCAGLPIVAMRAAGCGEFLRHDENALLAGDDAELSHHMARLATDDDLRRRLAEAKIDFARFEWPRVVDTHLDHYARAAKIARERNRNFQPGG